ncbi:MAG TPA: hypothetical protein DER40_14400 [Geobacter sp.]|nr:hypothetical protein [Geobacter sp.]
MKIFCFAILTLVLLRPYTAQASEGLAFAFVYFYKATAITEKTINTCAEKYPELAARGASTLTSWRQRNAVDAEKSAEMCETELHKKFTSDEKIAEAKARIEQIEQEYFNAFKTKIAAEGIAVCNEFLTMTERTEGDLSRVFTK